MSENPKEHKAIFTRVSQKVNSFSPPNKLIVQQYSNEIYVRLPGLAASTFEVKKMQVREKFWTSEGFSRLNQESNFPDKTHPKRRLLQQQLGNISIGTIKTDV